MQITMINIGIRWAVVSMVSIWTFSAIGCASHCEMIENPDKMGLVLFYRPKASYNRSLGLAVSANGFKINTLNSGSYFAHRVKPGQVQFSARSEITRYVTLDVEPGRVYYIKGLFKPGRIIGQPYLDVIAPEVARTEIIECLPKAFRKEQKTNEIHVAAQSSEE